MTDPVSIVKPLGGPSSSPLIRAVDISKSFGPVRALRGVSIDLHPGVVHGLVGANGAGKSTFLNVLGGIVKPDTGIVEVDGQAVTIETARASAALGFSFIHQELSLIPQFSAIDNMTLGMHATTAFGMGDRRRRRAAAREVAERLHLSFDLDRPVGELSVADRGMVEIGRALVGDARFVAMDEPTASLSQVECERLFSITRELASQGVAIAYVSHRLDEIEELCDIVSVFKDGQCIARHQRGAYTRRDLVLGITGASDLREVREVPPRSVEKNEPAVLTVSHIARLPRVRDVTFELRRGEILGLAGVVGAGRTEVARILFGADSAEAGSMMLDGKPYSPSSPSAAIRAGVGLVPEERRSQALIMDDSIASNISMGGWKATRPVTWLPFISRGKAERTAKTMADRLSIKMGSHRSAVRTLSGGNQQKVVFARWLAKATRVLLLDEPTRGVDVGARHQIWETVEQYVAEGNSAIVICSELQELAVCHRVVVMVEGRTIAVIDGPGVTEGTILETIYASENRTAEYAGG